MTSKSPPQHEVRIAALDGYRGLAVLMVTLYRFGEVSFTENVAGKLVNNAFYIGASGVDLFFVLSGFLITGILLESKTNTDYFSRFYFRRTLRIFPLYFASLFLFLLLLPLLGLNSVIQGDKLVGIDDLRGNPLHLWLYTSNLSIAWFNEWHFGALNHFWSLAIEEQFYLFWPLIVLWLAPRQLLKFCLIAWVALALIRIGFSISQLNDVASKTFTLFRMDGLLLGAAGAVVFRQRGTQLSKYATWLRATTVLTGTLYCATFALGKDDFTVRYALVAIGGLCLLLSTLACPITGPERRFFEQTSLCALGKYSYAMYIFQLPLIPLLAPWISPTKCATWIGLPIGGALFYVLVMFGLTYVLAMISWRAFEVHFLNLRKRAQFSRVSEIPSETAHLLKQS